MNIASRLVWGTIALTGFVNIGSRFRDRVSGEDSFSRHTNKQQKKHWISGMHEPYLPNEAQSEIIQKYFSEFQDLIPTSSEEIMNQCNLKTAVHIRSLSECPLPNSEKVIETGRTVVVGGPPALISTAFKDGITYINDNRRRPIASGSAFHLEWDAVSEAPTTSQPLHFMIDQLKRLILPEFLSSAEKTGHFSWKSLDWISWINNPSKWPVGTRIAIAFQRFTQSGSHSSVNEEVASRAKKNEYFYKHLDSELNGKLLKPGKGSIYIARTPDERKSLFQMKNALAKEKRELSLLSTDQILNLFKYLPAGLLFGEKKHDMILSHNFMSLLSQRVVEKLRGNVIDASVTTIYTDDPEKGGILAYRTSDGMHHIPFKKLVMSLGTQEVLGIDQKPLFDIVAARGVSTIALAYLPKTCTLPQAVVCGETNHVTKLAGPISFEDQNLFLLRMTCGACITPTSDSADYDATAAVGLKTAVSQVLKGRIDIILTYGCNRQVSQFGQTHWLQVPKTLKAASSILVPRGNNEDTGTTLPDQSTGIFIQYGAGGGGLTQAPSKNDYWLK